MPGDKGFKKSGGINYDDDMTDEQKRTARESWGPESGPTSDANRQAGDKAHERSGDTDQEHLRHKDPANAPDAGAGAT